MEDSRPSVHPLDLDPVLVQVFKHLDKGSLEACTLVNSTWKKVIWTTTWRTSASTVIRLRDRDTVVKVAQNETLRHLFRGFEFELRVHHLDEVDALLLDLLTSLEPKRLALTLNLRFTEENLIDKEKWIVRMEQFYSNGAAVKRTITTLLKFHRVISSLKLDVVYQIPVAIMNGNAGFPIAPFVPPPDEIVVEDIGGLFLPQITSLEITQQMSYDKSLLDSQVIIPALEVSSALRIMPFYASVVKKCGNNLSHFAMSGDIDTQEFWISLKANEDLRFLKSLVLAEEIMPQECKAFVTSAAIKPLGMKLACLKIRFRELQSVPIIRSMASSLEQLEFITDNETCLSPIQFGSLPCLQLLNTGNCQASFPSVTPAAFPSLKELWVHYWDWVNAFENVPTRDYYWHTNDPHPNVTVLNIMLPSDDDITMGYEPLESFARFCGAVNVKFPGLQKIYFRNCQRHTACQAISMMAEGVGERLKELKVVDWNAGSQIENTSNAFPAVTCKNLEVWDLMPSAWSKGDSLAFVGLAEAHWNIARIPDGHYGQLKVLKLLWIGSVKLSTLVRKFPSLEVLEIVGVDCIDPTDRLEMFKLKPSLRFLQHKCYCPNEDIPDLAHPLDWFNYLA